YHGSPKKGCSMRRVFARTRASLFVLVAILLGDVARAQVVGAILTGTVTDPSGAAVPGATVAIQNVATGIVTATQTNAGGIYPVPNLLPGEYMVSVEASGLSARDLPRLTLTVGEKQILNVAMQIATVTDTVNVSAGAGTVELGSAALSHVVDGRAAR